MYHQTAFLYDKIAAFEALGPVCTLLHESFLKANTSFPGLIGDLGSGTGLMAILLVEKGWSILGMDSSKEMLAVAQQKALALSPELQARLTWQEGEITCLQLPQNSLDGAICLCNTINHLVTSEAVAGFLKGAFHALKPQGLLILDSDSQLTFERFFNHPEVIVWEDDKHQMIRICRFDAATGRADHTVLLKDTATQRILSEEKLALQYHPEAWLHQTFLDAGFVIHDVKPFNPNPDLYAGDFIPKVLWTLQKP